MAISLARAYQFFGIPRLSRGGGRRFGVGEIYFVGKLDRRRLVPNASSGLAPGNRTVLLQVNSGKPQHQTVTDSPYAKPTKATQSTQSAPPPSKQNLDSMLGNLQADMSRQGVTTSQKGCCNACEKPIVGQVITALGKTWHPEHFTCAHCTQELGTRNFFERDGKPYCEPDYHNLFSPRCAYCNGPILDVRQAGRDWNAENTFNWCLCYRNASRL